LALRKAASSREHSVILTSRQHRKIARILRQNAPNFPFQKRWLEHKMARAHLYLVTAQELRPELAPKPRRAALERKETKAYPSKR